MEKTVEENATQDVAAQIAELKAQIAALKSELPIGTAAPKEKKERVKRPSVEMRTPSIRAAQQAAKEEADRVAHLKALRAKSRDPMNKLSPSEMVDANSLGALTEFADLAIEHDYPKGKVELAIEAGTFVDPRE
jgi:hypothetical protein